MSDSIFNVGTTAVYVGADSDNQKKVTKASGSSVYYKTASDVDSGDTELSTNVVISAGNWFVSAASTRLLVQDLETVTAQDITVTDDLVVTDDLTVTDDLDADAITATSVSVDGAAGFTASADGGKDTLALTNTTANVGITIGADTNLYRSAANTLFSDDALTVAGAVTAQGAATVGTTLGVTGATTLTGGVAASAGTPDRIWTYHAGATALTDMGQEVAPTAKTEYFSTIFVPMNKTVTGAGVLWGTIGGTDKVIFYLHNNAGTMVAETATAGTVSGDSDTFQEIAFTSPYAAVGPARYHLGVVSDGTTDKLQFVDSALGVGNFNGSKALAAFGTGESITPATTFTDAIGPIAYLY